MLDLHLVAGLSVKVLGQLGLLEVEGDGNGPLCGLVLLPFPLNDLAIGILLGHHEGHIVEKSVVSGVGLVLREPPVEGIHVGLVVVARNRLGDGGHLELGVIWYGLGILKDGSHRDLVVLIGIGGLGGRGLFLGLLVLGGVLYGFLFFG